MVKIISNIPSPEVTKEVVCRNCGVTLSYVPADLKEDYTTDYTGGKDYYKYIDCLGCQKQITIRN